jgi:hypothetical protein
MNEGRKDDGEKPRYDLIPPEFLDGTARVLTYGAAKYSLEIQNEWNALLHAPSVVEVQVITPKGSVVAVTRNTSDSPIPNLQSASVKIVETGKPETQIESATWQSVEKTIQQHVRETSGQNGSGLSQNTASPKIDTQNYAPLGALSAAQRNTYTLTIVTKQGDFEVSFAPAAITDSDFWTTVWKDLNVQYNISRPQSRTGERNWELGMSWGRVFAALMRHMWAWWGGQKTDAETGMSHLWHAACCLAFLVAYEQRKSGVDDRPTTKNSIDT